MRVEPLAHLPRGEAHLPALVRGGQEGKRGPRGGDGREREEDPLADRAHSGRGGIPEILRVPLEGPDEPLPCDLRVGEGGGEGSVLTEKYGEVHLVEKSAREKRIDERPLQAGEIVEPVDRHPERITGLFEPGDSLLENPAAGHSAHGCDLFLDRGKKAAPLGPPAGLRLPPLGAGPRFRLPKHLLPQPPLFDIRHRTERAGTNPGIPEITAKSPSPLAYTSRTAASMAAMPGRIVHEGRRPGA